MLLITPPALTFLMQVASPKEELVTAVYDLRHVSPAYFLQELDSPRNPRRPAGVASIVPDDVRSTITVKATPAGHTALKSLLAKIDTLRKPFEQPRYIHLYLHGTKDGKQALDIPLHVEENKSILVGIQFNQAELDEMKKRPWACQVPVKPEVALILIPHINPDGSTIRVEGKLVRSLPKAPTQTLVVPELTVTAGEKTAFLLSDALPPSLDTLTVTAWPEPTMLLDSASDAKQAALPIFAETRLQLKKRGEVLQAVIIPHAKGALAEYPFDTLLIQGQTLGVVAHFSADEKTAHLEFFLLLKDNAQTSLISLGTQSVTVGENTKVVLGKPLGLAEADELFIRIRRANPDDYRLP